MTREWFAKCKDCGKTFGYSDSSQELSNQRGLSRPERCPECRKLHSREIATLGLSHFELKPLRPLPEAGLHPAELGGLIRPPRVHELKEKIGQFDFRKFAIKDEHILEFFSVLDNHQVVVIVAPTGSGKSTFFPYRLMVPPEGVDPTHITRHGPIVVTQPRVQATRNIPSFVAKDLHGSSLGPGFDIGFRHHGSAATDWRNKLIYMTDGTLINLIVRNELYQIGLIMIDEAHERSLNIDLILGLLKAQLRRYPHLKLVIASATIDTSLFMRYYGAPSDFDPEKFKYETEEGEFYDNDSIETNLKESLVGFYGFPGKRPHPIDVRFRESHPIAPAQMAGRMPDEVAQKIVQILKGIVNGNEKEGDILAFLHGEKPIERACSLVRDLVDDDADLAGKVDILPLYTRLPQGKQDAALKPKTNKKRIRVVISTNVAETSLTVEGIVHVVDSGLINEAQWDPQSQTSFVTPKIHSQAGCRQRWGRAGRIMPGVAHCLYTHEQFQTLFPHHTDPEIVRAPLEQIVLTAKAAGISDVLEFNWIQSPPVAELTRAPLILQQIGALDADGDLTDHGLELRALSEETNIANLMIISDRFGCAVEMATIIPIIKMGGYTKVLRWDRSWNAVSKRSIHQLHQGLIGTCFDDLEFALKLWYAWEMQGFEAAWASQYFVDLKVLRRIREERDVLLNSLSAHKKDVKVRNIDFDLLTRLRILLVYGLPDQVYQLQNAAEISRDEMPIYTPYTSNEALRALHQDAIVEITAESVCFGTAPEWFVCGTRQRLRRRVSPQLEPETVITAAFLTLIHPQWLSVIGMQPIQVSQFLSDQTRTHEGRLRRTNARHRLMLDQRYPIGSLVNTKIEVNSILIETLLKHPTPITPRSSNEDVEAPEQIETLEVEGTLDENLGYDVDNIEMADSSHKEASKEKTRDNKKRHSLMRDYLVVQDEIPVWLDMIEDEIHEPVRGDQGTNTNTYGRFTANSLTPEVKIDGKAEALVTGYEIHADNPIIYLETARHPDPFTFFQTKYKVGDQIEVVLESCEPYVNDQLLYLIVREVVTGLEIVMDPYDISLCGRNFAVTSFEIGSKLTVEVEEINRNSMRVTRLRESQKAVANLMQQSNERVVDAIIADVGEGGLHLWLSPSSNSDPVGAYARLERLPNRPNEMWLWKPCRARIRLNQRRGNFRYHFSNIPTNVETELTKRIGRENWSNGLRFSVEDHSLTLQKPLTYEQRTRLLQIYDHPSYTKGINKLFRRSNEVEVREVIDMTGLQELSSYQATQERLPVRVVSIKDDHMFVQLPNGIETRIAKQEVTYDRRANLRELFSETENTMLEAVVKEIDFDQGRAKLSLLGEDPLDNYGGGQRVVGRITGLKDYGAFVEIEPGVNGLIPKREMSWAFINHPSEIVEIGQTVEVAILDIDREKREVSMTLCLPERDPILHYQVDQRLEGVVVGFSKNGNGAFVELEPGVEGFLHISQISLDRIEDARSVLHEGEHIMVRITSIHHDERRIGLTARALFVEGITLPLSHVQLVIGQGGETRKRIQSETFTRVEIDVETGECEIEGMDNNRVRNALSQITRLLSYHIMIQPIPSGPGGAGRLIGKGGSRKMEIETKCGVQLQVNDNQAVITAPNQASLNCALTTIRDVLCRWKATIAVHPSHIGRGVIGQGGTIIKQDREATGANIDVAKDNSGTITIVGDTSISVDSAITRIQARIPISVLQYPTQDTLQVAYPATAAPPRTSKRKPKYIDEPIQTRQETPRAVPNTSQVPVKLIKIATPPPTRPVILTRTIQLNPAQAAALTKKQGGLLATFLGTGQSRLEKIQIQTGASLSFDHRTNTLIITAHNESMLSAVQIALTDL